MRKNTSIFIMFIILFSISSCASVVLEPEALDNKAKMFRAKENSGLIYVYRENNFKGVLVSTDVFVNNEVGGYITVGTYIVIKREPGTYNISVRKIGEFDATGVYPSSIELSARDVKFVRISLNINNTIIEEVSEEVGRNDILQRKLAKAIPRGVKKGTPIVIQ